MSGESRDIPATELFGQLTLACTALLILTWITGVAFQLVWGEEGLLHQNLNRKVVTKAVSFFRTPAAEGAFL